MLVWRASGCEDLSLKLGGVGQHRAATIGLDPGEDFGQPLVLLADIFVASNVDEVNYWLG
jgi:hypothetical protein